MGTNPAGHAFEIQQNRAKTQGSAFSTPTRTKRITCQPAEADVPNTPPAPKPVRSTPLSQCELIDSAEMARRINVPESWVREQPRKRGVADPMPYLRFGKYVRFAWGSAALEAWLSRRIVGGNNRMVERALRKELQ